MTARARASASLLPRRYFVYSDWIHHSLTADTDDPTHEDMRFASGPVDVRIKAVHGSPNGAEYTVKAEYSLRPDVEPRLVLEPPLVRPGEDSIYDRLRLLFKLAAPDYFRFKLLHKKLGTIEVRARRSTRQARGGARAGPTRRRPSSDHSAPTARPERARARLARARSRRVL